MTDTLLSPLSPAACARAPGAATQTAVGLSLAAAVIGGWLALHVIGVFLYTPSRDGWAWAPPLALVQSWLGVGLFITAHDAMHGSLAVGRPKLNAGVGRLTVALYNPGFAYAKLYASHHAHHRAPGTASDPDFHPDRPHAYFAWFVRFFCFYFRVGECARLAVALAVYLLVLHARPLNLALFWGLPALGSAVQLFTFGTWLPHRHLGRADATGFQDRHRARSQSFGWWLSLLTCFHFGYHLEHHHAPGTPWWRLPRYRAERRRTVSAAVDGASV